MRRAAVSALFIVCLMAFLCPAVGKANAVVPRRASSCCVKMSACKMGHEQTPVHNQCPRDESQPRTCCTVSCSTMVLFGAATERFSTPLFIGYTFFSGDTTAFQRIDRPPVPPPRV